MNTPNSVAHPTPVRVLVADDEEAPRAQLEAALRKAWPQAQIVAACVNGADAWDAFLEHEPAVCFLDIRMPGLSGIEVAQRIQGLHGGASGTTAQVVFVTAFDDHAVSAFDAGAVDYVLKPVEAERLSRAVDRVKARLALDRPVAGSPNDAPDMTQLLQQLAGQLRRAPALKVLQASVGREVRLIRVEDVVYFEADARYTRVVFEDADAKGGEALIRTPLKELLTQIDPEVFWQVHRSVIVNHRHIAAAVRVDEGQMHLTLRGRADKLPVSRHFQGLFKGQ